MRRAAYIDLMPANERNVLEIDLRPFIQKEDALLMLAAKLFETERLTLGQAAELARMSKLSFVEALSRMGVPVFSYPAKELAGEISW